MADTSELRRPSNTALAWLMRAALALPLAVVVLAAVPRFVTGIALEAAFPATAYMALNIAQSKAVDNQTATILSHASPMDGGTQIARGEAAMLAGQPPQRVIPIVEAGLANAPSSARGWIVLARLLGARDPKRAAASLALAVELAPREYFLVVPRIEAAAPIWPYLPETTRQVVMDDTRRLLASPNDHLTVREILHIPGGTEIVTEAFSGHLDLLRAFNRSLARERLGLTPR